MEKDKKIEELIHIATQLHGYSRRYCDNRSSYAPNEHNMLTQKLLDMGVKLPDDPISTTGPFAKDGMYGLESEYQRWLEENSPANKTHLSFLAEQLQPFLESSPAEAVELAQNIIEQPHDPVDEEKLHLAFLSLAAHYLAAQRELKQDKAIVQKVTEYIDSREKKHAPAYLLYLELKNIVEQAK